MSLKRVRSGVSLARLAVEAEAQAALSPRCITVDALKRLHEYEMQLATTSEAKTALSPYLEPLGSKVVDLLPESVTPNLLSMVAFVLLVLASLNLILNSRLGAETDSAASVHLIYGVTLFLHQVADVAARKLVHKPGTSIALNVFFRQTCNTTVVAFLIIPAMLSLQIASPTILWVGTLFGLATCYMAEWQTYVTGKFVPASGRVGVSETVAMLAIIPLVTGTVGPWVWKIELYSGYCLCHVVLVVLVCRAMGMIAEHWTMILDGGPGDEGTTVAGTACLSPLPPIVLVVACAYQLLSSETYEHMPIVALIGVGFLSAKVTTKLIVGHVSRSPIRKFDAIFTPGIGMMINNNIFGIWTYIDDVLDLDQKDAVFIYLLVAFAFLNHAGYTCTILYEMSSHLGSGVFFAKPPKKTD